LRNIAFKETSETLLDASMEAGLKVNADKSKYIYFYCHENLKSVTSPEFRTKS